LQKRQKAQHLLEKVFEHLELVEKDYFGLQFMDNAPGEEGLVSVVVIYNNNNNNNNNSNNNNTECYTYALLLKSSKRCALCQH
jgi:hypothetical protein